MKYFLGPSYISPILYSAWVNVPQESLNHKTFFFFFSLLKLFCFPYIFWQDPWVFPKAWLGVRMHSTLGTERKIQLWLTFLSLLCSKQDSQHTNWPTDSATQQSNHSFIQIFIVFLLCVKPLARFWKSKMDVESIILASLIYQLCDLGQVSSFLWASVSLTIKCGIIRACLTILNNCTWFPTPLNIQKLQFSR